MGCNCGKTFTTIKAPPAGRPTGKVEPAPESPAPKSGVLKATPIAKAAS